MANYYHIRLPSGVLSENSVWWYRTPLPECIEIKGLVAFYDERLDVYVDGVLQPRDVAPLTPSASATMDTDTASAVEEFLLLRNGISKDDVDFAAKRKQAVRDAILRWHPDKFLTGCVLTRVLPEDKEMVKEAAGIVGRTLVKLISK